MNEKSTTEERIVFLDWLRVVACFLVAIMPHLKPNVSTPIAIFGCATATFIGASAFSLLVRRIPLVGKWICG